MGLAASQARMLLLVARKSDLEYRGQMINQRRLRIASQTESIAKTYSDAISNRTLKLKETVDGSTKEYNLDKTKFQSLANGFKLNYDSSVSSTPSAEQIEAGLRSGKYTITDSSGTKVDWRSDPDVMNYFNDRLYTEDDAQAEAIYEYKSKQLQTEDKKLEMELKNIDTQHQAIQTEVDAVKKVIDKNVESSFKTFNA